MLSWSVAYTVSEWLIRIVMVPVIARRKVKPSVCLGWLAVIFLAPWLGLAAYLLIGESKLSRRRLKDRLRRQETYAASSIKPAKLPEHENPAVREGLETLVRLTEKHGGMAPASGNAVEFMADGEVIDRLTADIDAAKDHIHLLFYMFADDGWGSRVIQALERAAGRGVTCRVLADDAGSRTLLFNRADELRGKGIHLVACLPVSPLRLHLARVDIRNHRKIAVIDGRIGYTGSQNLVRPEPRQMRAGVWRDIMARLEGPAVAHLQQVFLQDWYYETDEPLDGPTLFPTAETAGSSIVQVMPTGPDLPTEGFQDLVIHAIQSARESVSITSPYFIPDDGLLAALRLAVARGVAVDIIVPDKSDHPLVDLAGYNFCRQAKAFGAQVHLFQDGLLHSKIMTVDDTLSMAGSANFDIRSFYLDLELVLFFYDMESCQDLRRVQDDYKRRSIPLDTAECGGGSMLKCFGESIAKVLSPLL